MKYINFGENRKIGQKVSLKKSDVIRYDKKINVLSKFLARVAKALEVIFFSYPITSDFFNDAFCPIFLFSPKSIYFINFVLYFDYHSMFLLL